MFLYLALLKFISSKSTIFTLIYFEILIEFIVCQNNDSSGKFKLIKCNVCQKEELLFNGLIYLR